MDNKTKFSIVIPVYNAEKYISKCLKSVLKQTYDNFEVIIVNDGSTDNSAPVIEKYSAKYSSIKYIYQKNQGEFCARKTGVLAATGDYIAFIDPDDSYEPDMLQKINNEIARSKSDIIEFGLQKVRYGLKKKESFSSAKYICNDNLLADFINGHGVLIYAVWNKVYKTDVIRESIKDYSIRLKICADAYTNLLILTSGHLKTISVIPDVFYNYRQGSGVLSSTDKTVLYQETLKAKLEMYKHLLKNNKSKSIIRSLFIDVAVMTSYYAYIVTEKISNTADREKMISDIFLNNPTICEARKFFKENDTNVKEARAITDFDASQYNKYIEDYAEQYKNNLTFYQKVQNILHI